VEGIDLDVQEGRGSGHDGSAFDADVAREFDIYLEGLR